MIDPGVDPAVVAWMGRAAGGTVVRAERFVHTRPMWTVDVVRPDGALVELFARCDRGPASALSAVYDLAREALIVNALTRVGVPTPAFVAYEPQAKVLLLERARGRSDFTAIPDAARRERIAQHFIEVIAALHSVDVESLGLAELGIPRTADDLALQELVIGEQLFAASGCEPEPIVTLSQQWLYANVPRQDIAPCFLQGDTGPGNFMFEGDRVTYLVDWEIAHFGDPMEDLAAICVRDMVTPFADLPTLFARYAEVTAAAVDLDRVRYHRVSKCVRSLFAILSFTSSPSEAPEFKIWQAWRLLYLKSACQALAEAMGVELDPTPAAGPDEPCDSADVRSLYAHAHRQVERARPAMGALADRAFSRLA